MKNSKKLFIRLATFSLLIVIFGSAFNFIRCATLTRALVSLDLPNDQRVRLVQTFGGEPFDTTLYFDSGDGRWGCYYYDHEDWYWNKADSEIDGDILSIFRKGELTISLNTAKGTCTVKPPDGKKADFDKPMSFTDTLPSRRVTTGL